MVVFVSTPLGMLLTAPTRKLTMKSFAQLCRTSVICVALVSVCGPLWAQIRIGQSTALTGPAAVGGKENLQGAKLYLDAVNAKGGVNGQKIELITIDDKLDVSQTKTNIQSLIQEKNVMALFLVRGTPNCEAIIPLLNEHKIPLIAPATGAAVFHKPLQPYIFNVRATYQREVERAIEHLNLIGISRIALLHANDSFGSDAAKGAAKGFANIKKEAVFSGIFDKAKPEFTAPMAEIAKANAQAVLLIGAAQTVAEGVAVLRKTGSRAQVVTLSNNASMGFIKALGEHHRGIVISQVFPDERSVSSLLIKEAQQLAKAAGLTGVSPSMVEGFAGAKVLVEALKRAGKTPTRASITAALNSIQKFDLGSLEISYSEQDHTGLDFVDLSIVNAQGKFLR
jgi:branched-chain amino acid transport system substrate-binding protein